MERRGRDRDKETITELVDDLFTKLNLQVPRFAALGYF